MSLAYGFALPHWKVLSGGFSPASLFTGGEQGAWYDPSDFSTLFQDSAGTTPVTAVEQPVGLMLDKSKGAPTPGPELAPASSINGVAIGGPSFTTYSSASVVAGRWYRVSFTISGYSGTNNVGVTTVGVTAGMSSLDTTLSGNGTRNFVFVAASTGTVEFFTRDVNTANFSNISVRELPGNHAFQTTSTSRPTLRAMYNLLTFSEQFDNGIWAKTALNTTGTPAWVNVTTAPDGTTTADKLISTAVTSTHFASQVITLVASTNYTTSVYVKAAEYGWAIVYVGSVGVGRYIDLSSGAIGSAFIAAPTSTTVIDAGNGWWRVVVVFNSGANTSADIRVYGTTANGTSSYLGDGTSGILVWGAQLLTAADVTATGNAYQRIAAATSYDTSNPVFRPYLSFDGVDDSMLTNSVDFSSTDKMTVWAGVTKLSDATDAVLAELSASSSANNGSWLVAAPWDSGTSYYLLRSRGTTLAGAATLSSAYKAPATHVLTAVMDIVAPAATLRANGTQVATSTSSQGTGNYGNYPLYIGRRNNAGVPFNGRAYSLIVRGAESTAAQISSTESWVNQRTGAAAP